MPNRPARVLWVVEYRDAVNGSFAGLLEILRRLDRRRYEPLAVVPADGASARALAALGIPVLRRAVVPSGRNLRYLRAAWSFRRLLVRERVDLLYLADHSRWRPAELIAARWAGVPAVLQLLALPSAGLVADPSLRSARAIIGNSAAALQPLRGTLPDSVLHVVYNGIEFERFAPGPDRRDEFFPSRPPLVGFVGMFRPEKGVQHFLEMARMLGRDRPDVRYLAVGGDSPNSTRQWLAPMRDYAAELGVAELVHFTGPRTDIATIMRSLDVLVVPSLTESFPRVILEALAVGTPVVASAVGGVPEAIEPGVTGRLVPARDPGALAEAVRQALNDAAWRARVRATAPATVRERFDPARQVAAIEAVWDRVLERR